MGKLIEGFWDCNYCDTKWIRGSIRNCPNCGKARDDSTKFYLDSSEKHYVSDEKAAKINKNPNWVCNYCNQLNSDNDDTCISCGAPRTSENLNYFENKEKKKIKSSKKFKVKNLKNLLKNQNVKLSMSKMT